MEQQRRQEWRQARLASLEAESRRVNQLISDVNDTMVDNSQPPMMVGYGWELVLKKIIYDFREYHKLKKKIKLY